MSFEACAVCDDDITNDVQIYLCESCFSRTHVRGCEKPKDHTGECTPKVGAPTRAGMFARAATAAAKLRTQVQTLPPAVREFIESEARELYAFAAHPPSLVRMFREWCEPCRGSGLTSNPDYTRDTCEACKGKGFVQRAIGVGGGHGEKGEQRGCGGVAQADRPHGRGDGDALLRERHDDLAVGESPGATPRSALPDLARMGGGAEHGSALRETVDEGRSESGALRGTDPASSRAPDVDDDGACGFEQGVDTRPRLRTCTKHDSIWCPCVVGENERIVRSTTSPRVLGDAPLTFAPEDRVCIRAGTFAKQIGSIYGHERHLWLVRLDRSGAIVGPFEATELDLAVGTREHIDKVGSRVVTNRHEARELARELPPRAANLLTEIAKDAEMLHGLWKVASENSERARARLRTAVGLLRDVERATGPISAFVDAEVPK